MTTTRRTLRRGRWTRKKRSLHADGCDRPDVEESRRKFRRQARILDARRLMFLDEAGVDTSMTPHHGWAPKGRRVVARPQVVIDDGPRGSPAFPGAMDEPAFRTDVQDVLVS